MEVCNSQLSLKDTLKPYFINIIMYLPFTWSGLACIIAIIRYCLILAFAKLL